jgi:hypothetical protein
MKIVLGSIHWGHVKIREVLKAKTRLEPLSAALILKPETLYRKEVSGSKKSPHLVKPVRGRAAIRSPYRDVL